MRVCCSLTQAARRGFSGDASEGNIASRMCPEATTLPFVRGIGTLRRHRPLRLFDVVRAGRSGRPRRTAAREVEVAGPRRLRHSATPPMRERWNARPDAHTLPLGLQDGEQVVLRSGCIYPQAHEVRSNEAPGYTLPAVTHRFPLLPIGFCVAAWLREAILVSWKPS